VKTRISTESSEKPRDDRVVTEAEFDDFVEPLLEEAAFAALDDLVGVPMPIEQWSYPYPVKGTKRATCGRVVFLIAGNRLRIKANPVIRRVFLNPKTSFSWDGSYEVTVRIARISRGRFFCKLKSGRFDIGCRRWLISKEEK